MSKFSEVRMEEACGQREQCEQRPGGVKALAGLGNYKQ